MRKKSFAEINEKYDLEIERIVGAVREGRVKRILLQFPEGMKPYAQVICDEVGERADCKCFIWMGTCFGACDVPNVKDVDLIVQFGHSAWGYGGEKGIEVL